MYLLLRWLLNTLALFIVVHVVPGFHYRDLVSLAIAALVLGLLNAIVRPILFLLTLPLTIVTLGLFLVVLNAIMLELTDAIVPGFGIDSFGWAIVGALVLAIVSVFTNRIGTAAQRGD
ncbi:MAG TPA: phage holin family protein [Thermoanaerobaculia bacterium]|nr:phage holin family protein [Thermoanaerobaculia bacterium]